MNKHSRWFIFHENLLLISKQANDCRVPQYATTPDFIPSDCTIHDIQFPSGETVKACAIKQTITGEQWQMIDLRSSYNLLPLEEYKIAGKAFQILYWDKHSQYCPQCGTPTEQCMNIMKRCPQCGNEIFPTISTAIIVLIRKGDEVLLVRGKNFRGTFYGLVAGFLEVGETLEECVRREVLEETGLYIKNIQYFDSQSWPYPSGLMVGFIADYDHGDIKLQTSELSDGAFFHRNNLPELPQKLSIARRLIDWWLST